MIVTELMKLCYENIRLTSSSYTLYCIYPLGLYTGNGDLAQRFILCYGKGKLRLYNKGKSSDSVVFWYHLASYILMYL